MTYWDQLKTCNAGVLIYKPTWRRIQVVFYILIDEGIDTDSEVAEWGGDNDTVTVDPSTVSVSK